MGSVAQHLAHSEQSVSVGGMEEEQGVKGMVGAVREEERKISNRRQRSSPEREAGSTVASEGRVRGPGKI